MNATQIREEVATILGLPFNSKNVYVRRHKVAYTDQYQWIVQTKSINLSAYKDDLTSVYPGVKVVSAVYATIPVGQ